MRSERRVRPDFIRLHRIRVDRRVDQARHDLHQQRTRRKTVTDTFSSTNGAAHSIDLLYEDDLGSSTAGWEFPGQTSFGQHPPTGPAAGASTGTYVIDDTSSVPSLSNPVGAITYSTPYKSVGFDNTLWPSETSGLFDDQAIVPAGGSVSIGWSYATGTSLAEVQGYAAAAQDVLQPPAVTISSPTAGASLEPAGEGDRHRKRRFRCEERHSERSRRHGRWWKLDCKRVAAQGNRHPHCDRNER